MIVADRYVRPMFAIGDSHSGPLNALLMRSADDSNTFTIGESWCVPGLMARHVLNDRGGLHKSIIAALAGFHLLRNVPLNNEEGSSEPTIVHEGMGFVPTHIVPRTPLLFLLGELDARDIIRSIPLDCDLELDFSVDDSGLPGFDASRVIAAAELHESIFARFDNLFRMASMLQGMGFGRLAIASITPPTLDDDDYRRLCGIESHAKVRVAVHLAINRTIESFCSDTGVAFVNTWNDATSNGTLLKDGYLRDGVHFGIEGSAATLSRYYALCFEA